jgi:hypothetical protein
MRAIVADNRNSVHLPSDPAAKVIPVGAGKVAEAPANRSGWIEPRSLETKEWAYMSAEERKARNEEWAREFAARRAAEAKDRS